MSYHPVALGCAVAAGGVLAGGCATGVDVTDEELAAICSEPNTRCATGTAGASVGSVGGSTAGGFGGSSNGGTFNAGGSGGSQPSNGGSVSTNGGTGGSLGSAGTAGAVPLAEGECLPMDDIVVLYRDRNSGVTSTNEPSMVLQVQNPAGASFPLSDLSIRYWFTADGTSNFIGTVDYATVTGQGNISGIMVQFAQEFGSDYAELTFPTATDTVGAEGVRELQLRFHANPYAPLNQANDFSFLSSAAMPTPNRNVTPYLRNEQVGGCVPIP